MGHVKRLQAELDGMQDVLRRRDMDLQRTKMIIKLKEDKIARLQVGSGPLLSIMCPKLAWLI